MRANLKNMYFTRSVLMLGSRHRKYWFVQTFAPYICQKTTATSVSKLAGSVGKSYEPGGSQTIPEAVVAFVRAAERGIIIKPHQRRDTTIAFNAQQYSSTQKLQCYIIVGPKPRSGCVVQRFDSPGLFFATAKTAL